TSSGLSLFEAEFRIVIAGCVASAAGRPRNRNAREQLMDIEKYGPWALVIGGSEGVGAAFARLLAADGFKLVLVARKPGPLEELAAELRAGGAEVRLLSADLAQPEVLAQVRTVTDDIEVGLLIYNAG